jgi:hypothetical protein
VWIARELLRLLSRIFVAVAIAVVIAEVRAIASGGDVFHTFKIVLMLLGVVLLLMAGTGTGSAASRRVNWGVITPGRGSTIFRGFQPRPEDPALSPSAVFVGSGATVLLLGLLI